MLEIFGNEWIPPGWWVILHHHATCGQTSKRIVFPASATSCNLQLLYPCLLFPQAQSRQQADWCRPGVGPSGWTSCSRGLSAVNRQIQNYSRGGGGGGVYSQTSRSLDSFLSLADTELRPVVCRLRTAWETWSLLGERGGEGSLILKILDHLIPYSLSDTELQSSRSQTKNTLENIQFVRGGSLILKLLDHLIPPSPMKNW